MITVDASGSFKNTESFLRTMTKFNIFPILHHQAARGVTALSIASPIDTGRLATSWDYEITQKSGFYTISWLNYDRENGFPVAIMLQYGHGTKGGGYIQGRDYINPAIRPIFDDIANEVWKVVTSA